MAAEHKVPFHSCSFWEANVRCIRQLRLAAQDARSGVVKGNATERFRASMLYDGLNAIG